MRRTGSAVLLLTALILVPALFAGGTSSKTPARRLPRQPGYQAELVGWLGSIRTEDVAFQPAPLRYDGSFTNATDLANLWVELRSSAYLDPNGEAGCKLFSSEPKWFVLNDGAGAGIETDAGVRMFRSGVLASYWQQRSIPLADGKQGNPCYGNEGLLRRALVTMAVDMLMQDQEHDINSYNARSDFLGGQLNAWAYTYLHGKGVLDAKTRSAFEAGFSKMLDKILKWGPQDVNTNMDIRAISAAAYVYRGSEDPGLKAKAVGVARRFLFGQEDGTLATLDNRFRKGLFNSAGYIAENQGAETTYNGVSLYHLLEAHAITRGDPNWAFLEEIVRRMLVFKLHQYFRDPDGYFDGPSGYANRTGNSYVYDQRDRAWRDHTAAGDFLEGRPLLRGFKYRGQQSLPSVDMIARHLQQVVAVYNQRGFGKSGTATPPLWQHEHWPPDMPYSAAPGWYEKLARLEAGDASLLTPFERPEEINRAFGDEFWVVKKHDGKNYFGFLVESMANSCYGPWLGGSLQIFWSDLFGILLLAMHDKTGDEDDKAENTRVWSQIDTWATHHIWGRDAARLPLSTAVDIRDNKVTHAVAGKSPHVEVVSSLVRGPGAGGKGSTDGEVIPTTAITTRFETTADGVAIHHQIELDKTDKLAELWCTLPVFLRNAAIQPRLKDSTIEYWNGSIWQTMNTELVSTKLLRVGRDFGAGARYGYIHFDQAHKVKLSQAPWQASYQSRNRIRNIHIDLHGEPGTVRTPATKSIRIQVGTHMPA